MSRKDDAAKMLIEGQSVVVVAAATGLQRKTVSNIARRLRQPIEGDSEFTGTGLLRCRACGQPCSTHSLRSLCAALAPRY